MFSVLAGSNAGQCMVRLLKVVCWSIGYWIADGRTYCANQPSYSFLQENGLLYRHLQFLENAIPLLAMTCVDPNWAVADGVWRCDGAQKVGMSPKRSKARRGTRHNLGILQVILSCTTFGLIEILTFSTNGFKSRVWWWSPRSAAKLPLHCWISKQDSRTGSSESVLIIYSALVRPIKKQLNTAKRRILFCRPNLRSSQINDFDQLFTNL